jgi:hypothetical protein
MKTLIRFLALAMICNANAQSLSPTVVTTSGGYYPSNNASLSWTLGEIATETFSNGGYILTQGFQQPYGIIISGINLDLLVYLEGPFSVSEMGTSLNSTGLIPLSQPYNAAPWNYSGSESVLSIPNPNVVDWVLIELRDAANAGSATPSTRIARKAAFILKDGSVVGTDGSSILQFNNSFNQQLFIIVWHRNHLGIMTANGVTASGGVYVYDFSTSETKVYGGSAGYKALNGGLWGMVAGDSNHEGIVNLLDKTDWASDVGKKGYMETDFSMDAQVNNVDKNDKWYSNYLKQSQVPQ